VSHAKTRASGKSKRLLLTYARPFGLFGRSLAEDSVGYQRGLRCPTTYRYNHLAIFFIAMLQTNPNSHLPECWLRCLVCPRRYRANLPSRLRPSLFGSD